MPANSQDPLARAILLHVCKDGTITYRTREQPIFNGVALPFFSVDTVEEAESLQIMCCKCQYTEHPKLPGQPWYAVDGFDGEDGDIDQIDAYINRVRECFARAHYPITHKSTN